MMEVITNPHIRKARFMKYSKSAVYCKTHSLPVLKFESQKLTSFSGLIVLQQLFSGLDFATRIAACFRHHVDGKIFSRAKIFLQLVIHILLGYRELRESCFYRDDPLVKRLLGLRRLPDVSTISRMLKDTDARSVEKLRRLQRDMALERLRQLQPARITLDFDGSVQSTTRCAEGSAVGFNKKKKGARSYYPLFCTIAQTGQVLDFLHRSGNVHDSNGARHFIVECLEHVSAVLGPIRIEVRMDAAFFSDEIITLMEGRGVEFTVSVPFERFVELKNMIENRQRWRRLDAETSFFQTMWRPKSWDRRRQFLFLRTRSKKQHKGPVQLDLFVPYEYGYDFKVIISNKDVGAQTILRFHNGRGAQEGIFAELKTNCQMDYVPVRRRCGNQIYLLASTFAHNLARELQMQLSPPLRGTSQKRIALWPFKKLDTLRATLLHRAGRLTRPSGQLTLTVSGNHAVKAKFLDALRKLRAA